MTFRPRERDTPPMHDPADENDYGRRKRSASAALPEPRTGGKGRNEITRHGEGREEAIEWMVYYAVEEEMKRRHPERYQDPDDRAGTA
ncbi:MAG: hypothetical protein MRJ68_08685 [Nitrospira sp.]|nr:hypothetical protein [Nitrospira sp.]